MVPCLHPMRKIALGSSLCPELLQQPDTATAAHLPTPIPTATSHPPIATMLTDCKLRAGCLHVVLDVAPRKPAHIVQAPAIKPGVGAQPGQPLCTGAAKCSSWRRTWARCAAQAQALPRHSATLHALCTACCLPLHHHPTPTLQVALHKVLGVVDVGRRRKVLAAGAVAATAEVGFVTCGVAGAGRRSMVEARAWQRSSE